LVLGLLALCAASLCVVGVSGASAATWFECRFSVPVNTGTWENPSCTQMSGTDTGVYQWIENIQGKKTKLSLFQQKKFTLRATIFGQATTIQCSEVSGEGTATNEKVGETMQALGSSIKVSFKKCTVPQPESLKCSVKGGAFEIPNAQSTTFKAETETRVKITPTTGTTLGQFTIEGCLLSGTYLVTGGVVGIPNGSNLFFTEQSSKEGGLKVAGGAATLEGEVGMEAEMSEEEGGGLTALSIQ
jgi:hypothetical protein